MFFQQQLADEKSSADPDGERTSRVDYRRCHRIVTLSNCDRRQPRTGCITVTDHFREAAGRHRHDARYLATEKRYQNAGHLLGFAAECLTKGILESVGIKIDKHSGFRAHFPELAVKVRLNGRTRVMSLLTPILNDRFLRDWRANCRYEGDLSVDDAKARYGAWHADVDSLFKAAKGL